MDLDYIKSRIHEIMLKRIAMGAGEGMYGESMHGYGDGYGEGYRRKRVTRKRKHHDEMHILPIVVKAGMRHSKGAGEGYRKRRATRRRHSDEVHILPVDMGMGEGYRRKRTAKRRHTRGAGVGAGVLVGGKRRRHPGQKKHNPWLEFLKCFREKHRGMPLKNLMEAASREYNK
jgi:hypothetical protein